MKWQTAEMNALVQTGRSNRKQPTRKRTSSGAVSVPEVFSLKVHGDSVSEPDCPLQRPRRYSPARVCVCVCVLQLVEGGGMERGGGGFVPRFQAPPVPSRHASCASKAELNSCEPR